jgi:hypothetical protein
MFVAVGKAKQFRTMGHLVLNSEQWAWMIICAAWIGTAGSAARLLDAAGSA